MALGPTVFPNFLAKKVMGQVQYQTHDQEALGIRALFVGSAAKLVLESSTHIFAQIYLIESLTAFIFSS
ncbi:hypothetical protein AB1K32_26350 [Metabacillus dongyingensis]|uniref:hypothetical protein n=1 Tax=Metabacillus dongyingensis TaxID=2874282 RepID=UPI003B8BC687